jgi:hypothetical protein
MHLNMRKKIKHLYYAIRRGTIRVKGFFLYDIKHFIQRGRRGWSDRDWWDNNYYFLEVQIGMLKTLKKCGMGLPNDISEEQWNKILKTIIEGFEAKLKIYDKEHYIEPEGEEMPDNPMKCRPHEDGSEGGTIHFSREAKDYFAKCYYDEELGAKWEAKFQEAMKLFVKYFDSLND